MAKHAKKRKKKHHKGHSAKAKLAQAKKLITEVSKHV